MMGLKNRSLAQSKLGLAKPRLAKPRLAKPGQALLLVPAIFISSLMVGVLAVDLPAYYVYQNQLQTAVNAAALAGANALPNGENAAQNAAYELASQNLVAGNGVTPEQLNISYLDAATHTMEVKGEVPVPTLLNKFVCALQGGGGQVNQQAAQQNNGAQSEGSNCDFMTVKANAKAVPAARDTMLAIDNSSSMTSLGNNRPLSFVISAAKDYANTIDALQNQSVDRIGLVKFAYDATLLKPLKSSTEDSHFGSLKTSINGISAYNAQGWNTNYEAPLIKALDEIESRGRQNATRVIIYLTDGYPNLPAPPSFYSYSTYQPYNKCVDIVNNSSAVRALCTRNRRGQITSCPTMPDSRITPAMIPNSAYQCGLQYTNYLTASVTAQVERAKQLGVTIHTIRLGSLQEYDNAQAVLRQLIKNPTWDPKLLEVMTETTNGQMYQSTNYNQTEITNSYKEIAEDIKVRLAG